MNRCCENCVHGDMDNSCSRTFSKDEKNLAYGIKFDKINPNVNINSNTNERLK